MPRQTGAFSRLQVFMGLLDDVGMDGSQLRVVEFRVEARHTFGFVESASDDLVETVEIPAHPWFLASQFHPEFTSNPRDGHPLFKGFITAARQHHEGELPKAAEA